MKIIVKKGSWATVEASGHRHQVCLDLVPSAQVGDFVIAHQDLAIGTIEAEEAKKIKLLNKQLDTQL